MGKFPEALRAAIAQNIRACRLKKFPGRGGGKRCAEAFGVTPQQWSPWESGKRTPDELRLQEIATFFEVDVEYLRRDNSREEETNTPGLHSVKEKCRHESGMSHVPFSYPTPGMPPLEPSGSPASFYRLLRHVVQHLLVEGIKVQLDEESIVRIVRKCQDRL